jgi:hypothetical protein
MKRVFAISLLLLTLPLFAQVLPAGTYPVGTGHAYTNLGDIAAALRANTVSGNLVFELQGTYNSASETFPLVFGQFNNTGGSWTVTIRPDSGVSVVTSGDPGTGNALITFDSTDRIMFDGRQSGTGIPGWIIRNTQTAASPVATPAAASSAGPVFQFRNGATFDTLAYLQVEGSNPVSSSGLVFFGNSVTGAGNNWNAVMYCDIRDRSDTTAGTATPACGIMSSGSTGALNRFNSVTHNHIFNYFYPSTVTQGIRIDAGSSDWDISHNKLYQESLRIYSAATLQRGIWLNNPESGNNFSINENTIGFSSPLDTGTYEILNSAELFVNYCAIFLTVASDVPTIVQGNRIRNFDFNTVSTTGSLTTSPAGFFEGIHHDLGKVHIHHNIIGDTNAVTINLLVRLPTISFGTSYPACIGIASVKPGATIEYNYVSGINVKNPATSNHKALFYGISSAGGSVIHGNVIGSRTMQNSIVNSSALTSTSGNHVTCGIAVSVNPSVVTANTIGNLSYLGGSTSAQVAGIISSGTTGLQKIGTPEAGNEIYNLVNNAPNTGTAANASVIGISHTNTAQGHCITRNRIHSLYNTHATTTTHIVGIHFNGAATGRADTISCNLIRSLVVSSSGTASTITGIYMGISSSHVQNNMISLGFDSAGNVITSGYGITGLHISATGPDLDDYFHNTVVVGGTGVASASNTTTVNRTPGSGETRLQNNILVNTRSNASGSASNFVLRNFHSTNAGLYANNNLYFRNGAGTVLFSTSLSNMDSLSSWQTFTSPALDLQSAVTNPLLQDAAGGPGMNLRPQTSNPVESGGIQLPSVTHDFDGKLRQSHTPSDIGAAAGNDSVSADFFPPRITFDPVANGVVATTRTLTSLATITDNHSVDTGNNRPRLYFKQTSELDAFPAGNNSGFNGWKYVMASNTNSPYSFTIDYSLLSISPVNIFDTIQYFIAAQDTSNNLTSYPALAMASTSPSIQNISSSPQNPYYFVITTGISGAKTVCDSACNFNSLTRDGGLFSAMDSLAVSGDIVATITGDLQEDGSHSLNYFGSVHKLRITTNGMHTVSNNTLLPSTTPMIHINGAMNVTIDGDSQTLVFKNTNPLTPGSTSPTIQYSNGASRDTLRNCVVQGNGSGLATATIVIGGSSGNVHHLVIEGNAIGDTLPSSTQPPAVCILSNHNSNSELRITGNHVYNFSAYGIHISQFNSGCYISGNSVFYNRSTPNTSAQTGIYVTGGTGHFINDNYIGGRANHLAGGAWLTSSSGAVYGIHYASPGTVTISNNQVGYITNQVSSVLYGIYAISSANPYLITGNEVHDLTSAGTQTGLNVSIGGIILSSSNLYNVIRENTIHTLRTTATTTGANGPALTGIGSTGTTGYIAGAEISANRIFNFLHAGSGTGIPDFRGIGPLQGTVNLIQVNVTNNFVALGAGVTGNVKIEGIWNNSIANSEVNVIHNSVLVTGNISGTTASANSMAYMRSVSGSKGIVRNNIFYNMRSGGAGVHAAIGNTPANSQSIAWDCDYNVLFSNQPATRTGIWGSSALGLTAWQSTSANDLNSVVAAVQFADTTTGDLHLTGSSIGNITLKGTPVSVVAADYDGQSRDAQFPYMGADEIPSAPLPVNLHSFRATASGDDVLLHWMTASEKDLAGFIVERSADGEHFFPIAYEPAQGYSYTTRTYQWTDRSAFTSGIHVWYYRLKIADADGSTSYSPVVAVSLTAEVHRVIAYPNPFVTMPFIVPGSLGQIEVSVRDLNGRELATGTFSAEDGSTPVAVDMMADLDEGVYILTVRSKDEISSFRLIKLER